MRNSQIESTEWEALATQSQEWCRPLSGDSPSGVDLEYHNDFLAMNLAVAGKPETQFSAPEPPDWRGAFELAAELLDRSRDLRIAIVWFRAGVRQYGLDFVPMGLRLLNGMLESLWDHLHPMPDPDDNDPYARVNSLMQLSQPEMTLADLRNMQVVSDRAIGELTLRGIEEALGRLPARNQETALSKEQAMMMMSAALEKSPSLRALIQDCVEQSARLVALVNERLDLLTAPDLRPLTQAIGAIVSIMPPDGDMTFETGEAVEEGRDVPSLSPHSDRTFEASGIRSGLPGRVNSREEAVRAIELVCEYLERTEPTNPAQLFLRRARFLLGQNFLQLVKELAPEALASVARVVGVDPESV